ncbi:MAG TPA: glycosyltransferase [Stellaceae bacterium]|jgi:glycosyltransferase involved in cell wall biosynthesis|nr:glycosyltransferase [Stellaceae bacterium]
MSAATMSRPIGVGEAQGLRVDGRFFRLDGEKYFVKGVTYGPFADGSHGAPFPEPEMVARDFALMAGAGVNTVRVFTVPPVWLLDAAAAAGLRVIAGLPWSQHIAFLANAGTKARVRAAVQEGVRACERHPAIFAYLVGNEVPPDMIRWHGAKAVSRFLAELHALVKAEHPGALVSYASFPSTEYLSVDFADFLCFNVYLHDEHAFRRYLARLHNIAFDKPLVLTEFGGDSMHAGEAAQAALLSWQVEAAFSAGVAGTCVFAWTDEWFTGGHAIEDWAFGLVDKERQPKPSFAEVARVYRGHLPPALPRTPRVSVVVCAYNSEATIEQCLASLEQLNYPDYEVIVVNDGANDRTREIAERFPNCRLINQENRGLSVARNVGAEAATGEIVAYTDSDCVADPDWLDFLVGTMERGGLAACGGPNFPPPEDSLVPAAVAVSPGGPCHVLLDDELAEHIAGCNMAFRRDVLLGLGGFDPVFRAAGDDVDICWRLQDAGYAIGFSAAAMVWHFRRNTVRAYIGQQRGYGKAEALVYAKHPQRFNRFGQAMWGGRIYGDLSSALLLGRTSRIYSGVFGRGLFQSLYERPTSILQHLPMTFEWGLAAPLLALAGIFLGGWHWLLAAPLLLTWTICVTGAARAKMDPRFTGLKARALVALLIYLGPLWRGYERLKWRLKALRETPARPVADGPRPALSWSERGFVLSYWSEEGDEKEDLLGGLMAEAIGQGYPAAMDSGWGGWDLTISRGPWERARVLVGAENHGGVKRLYRVRCMPVLTGSGRAGPGLIAAGAALMVMGWPMGGVFAGLVGLAATAGIVWRMNRFAGRMRGLIDRAAGAANLTALDVPGRGPLPTGAPRTA